MVFSIALRILGDRSAAEEAAQDVFLELHGKLGELTSAEHVVYWLRRVTVHRSIDYVRKRQRRPEVPMDWDEMPEVPDLSSAADQGDPLLSRWLQHSFARFQQ
jgi:RNA polymerase sigma-70 factor, ECF subfamily